MKKFLFTLATLLMASSAFATNVYIPDTEFTADQIGKVQLLPVYLVLDNEYVNGWDFTFTYPEGLTIGTLKKNNAVLNQTAAINEDGDEETVSVVLNGDAYHNIGAIIQGGYWDPDGDGVYELYGAVKIGPTGEFKLYEIRVTPTEAFTGGDILITWMYSGGFDNRNGQPNCQLKGTTTVHLTAPAAPQKEDCESPSVMGATGENGEYYIQITPDPATDGALQYTVDVEPARVEVVEGITYLYYNRGEEDVPVHVVAWTAEGETYNASAEEVKDITIPKLPQVATPVVTYTMGENNTIIITATCDTEGATVTLYDPEGNAVTMPATVNYDPYVGYNATWTAKATAPYMLDSETGSTTITIAADEKTEVDSPSIIGYPDEDGVHYIIVITPASTDGELMYTVDPAPGAKATELVYTRGEEPYTVHVEAWTAEGPTCQASDKEIKDITVPALAQVAKPNIVWTMGEEPNTFVVTATCDTEGATVTLYNPEGDAVANPATVTYDPEEGYAGTWTAQATKENMLDSEIADKLIEIAPQHTPKVYQTPEPVIEVTDDPENEQVIVKVTGEGALHVDIVGAYNNIHENGTEPELIVYIPYGEEEDMVNIHATAVANLPEGYDEVAGNYADENYVVIPAKEVVPPTPGEKPGVPEVKQVLTADNVTVSAAAENADEVIMYLCDAEGNILLDEENNPQILANPSTIARGETTVTFYVLAVASNENGETWMDAPATVVIPGKTVTGVDELVNGKNIAAVRYFNMAGQEMQKVEGVTIVVTTYTDGTTSAVKVIK